MSNELSTISFDYDLIPEGQAMQLRIISERIKVRVQRTAEEMLAMGADLIEAKKVCKEDGKLFSAWCESDECPVGYKTAQSLMSVNKELGCRKEVNLLFNNSLDVLSRVTQTREEDIKQALLEHIEAEADKGEKVTQKEINLLKKTLKESKVKIESLEDESFDAQLTLKQIVSDRDKLKERNKKLLENANAEYEKRQELEAEIKDKEEELNNLDDAFEEDMKEREIEIKAALAEQPLTFAQVEEKKQQLKDIDDKRSEIQVDINKKNKELKELQEEFSGLEIRDRALNEFNKGALNYRETILLLMSGCNELKNTPMDNHTHEEISSIIQLTEKALEALKDVISVEYL